MGRRNVKTKATIVVDSALWKEFKKLCIDEDKAYSQLLEELIKRRVKQ